MALFISLKNMPLLVLVTGTQLLAFGTAENNLFPVLNV